MKRPSIFPNPFRLLCVAALFSLLLFSSASHAQFSQPGELDTTFNFGRPHSFFTDPSNPVYGIGANAKIRTLTLQSDGKVLIGGDFTTYNGIGSNRIARLNPDGTLDATFNSGAGADGYIETIAIQSDGKILIGGDFSFYNGVGRNKIARLNSNGSLDTSFNIGLGANDVVHTSLIQPDGKIIIAGDFTSYNGIGRNRIARIWGGNTVAGIETESLTHSIPFVYPNPTQAFIQVKVGKSFTYTIHSIHGILLDQGVSNEPEMTLHTNEYRSGTYLLRVVTNEGISVQKFIKE